MADGKRILILGGTKFLGRGVVDAALAGGHAVTLFNRGRTNPDLYPEVEKIRGDRTVSLAALSGRSWDAVIDVAAYEPEVARRAAEALAKSVGRYVFVSTVSVYSGHERPGDQSEEAPLLDLATASDDVGEQYGAKKVACERAVQEVFGGRATIARPGLIVGPHDPTDRFGYWPRRLARGGRVLAPGSPSDKVQFIDVRDLGQWLVHAAVDDVAGVFNLVAPSMGFGELIEACRVPAVPSEVVWIDSEILIGEGVEQWMGLPLWIAEPGWEAANDVPCDKVQAAGLSIRPVGETVEGAREDNPPGPHTLTLERERELLEKLAAAPD